RASVVVIDNSFSLQTGDRWSDLKTWARHELGNPSAGDTVGLLLMNPRPSWLVPPTQDTASAFAALDELSPGWETTRAEPALRLAADTLAASSARTRKLIYLGDHQSLGWAGADFTRKLPAGVGAVFPEPTVATAKATAAPRQASLSAPALRLSGETATASVTVRNFGPASTRTLRLFADTGSDVVHTEELALAANEVRALKITLRSNALSKEWIRFALDADDLPADDTAWALSPAATNTRRLLLLDRNPAGADADYIATASQTLAALPPELRIGSLPQGKWPAPAAAVLRGETSFNDENAPRLDAFLAAGGSALVMIDGSSAQLRWLAHQGIVPVARASGDARLRDWAIDHPLVAPLAQANLRSLVGWTFKRGWSLPADSVEPLASWTDGTPALGELRIGGGRVLLAGFTADRRDGDWPIAPAFVPFIHRVILHLLQNDQVAGNLALVGQPLALPEGDAGNWRALDGPATSRPSASVSGSLTPQAPGIYEWTRGGERSLHAVNLPPEESDLTLWNAGTPWLQLVSEERVPPSVAVERLDLAAQDAEQQSPLWWWCFAAMALFALTELAFANRTTR
ncbi:MAG: VWA domain-containing protein, partial [Rariglobus sp.]